MKEQQQQQQQQDHNNKRHNNKKKSVLGATGRASTTPIPSSMGMILLRPSENDIVFGRGRPFQAHPGNLRMKTIIDPYVSVYQSAPRHLKMKITRHVIRVITDSVLIMDPTYTTRMTKVTSRNPGEDAPASNNKNNKQRPIAPTTPPAPTSSPLLVRFLKQNPDYREERGDGGGGSKTTKWLEASKDEIFSKVSHCLRKKEDSSSQWKQQHHHQEESRQEQEDDDKSLVDQQPQHQHRKQQQEVSRYKIINMPAMSRPAAAPPTNKKNLPRSIRFPSQVFMSTLPSPPCANQSRGPQHQHEDRRLHPYDDIIFKEMLPLTPLPPVPTAQQQQQRLLPSLIEQALLPTTTNKKNDDLLFLLEPNSCLLLADFFFNDPGLSPPSPSMFD